MIRQINRGELAPSWPLKRGKNIEEWKHAPHSFLLLVSPAIKYVPVYAVRRRQRRAVCTESLSRLHNLYCRTQKPLAVHSDRVQSLKMTWVPSMEARSPPASCFTAHPTAVWPSGSQLLWTTVSLQLRPMPKACVKLIQYHRLYACSTLRRLQPERRDMVLLWSAITLSARQMGTEIGARHVNVSQAAASSCRRGCMGKVRRRAAVPVHGHKVNQQSCT